LQNYFEINKNWG